MLMLMVECTLVGDRLRVVMYTCKPACFIKFVCKSVVVLLERVVDAC